MKTYDTGTDVVRIQTSQSIESMFSVREGRYNLKRWATSNLRVSCLCVCVEKNHGKSCLKHIVFIRYNKKIMMVDFQIISLFV